MNNYITCTKCRSLNSQESKFCKACGEYIGSSAYHELNQVEYAGFWLRVAAYLIDGLVFFVPSILLSLILLALSRGESAAQGITNAILLPGIWLYHVLLESSEYQATLGKMAVGIKVMDLHGERISFGKANGRFFGKILSGLILYFGFFMIGWTKSKQGLHDFMANTLVVKK